MSEPSAQLRYHHQLSVHRRIGSLDLAANLKLHANWTILFGPSGSGKSSLLRAACGLLGDKGIRFTRSQDDEAKPLQDETTFTPPHLRKIRWAPQNAALFPHLTVHQNISFGDSVVSKIRKPDQLAEIIDLFQLQPLLKRRPGDLSGGERQRVNLARAFAALDCRLMLLDEPFNGIDSALRDTLLPRLRTWLRDRGVPVLSVTHDVEEALQLQAEVVVLRDGKVETEGYVSKVLAPERERLLASLNTPR